MPCKRYSKFDPDVAVKVLGVPKEEAKFPRGMAIFSDVSKDRVLRAYRLSGMKDYPKYKNSKKSPHLQRIVNYPSEDMLLSGYVIPCNVKKEEGRMAVEIACIPYEGSVKAIKGTHFDNYNDFWSDRRGDDDIGYTRYACYGWSKEGWKKPEESI